MQTFKNLLNEARGDKVVFTFGRFNPPTTGHELLINKLVKASSGGYVPMVFTSHSNDAKKNPLTHKQKVFYLNKFFGTKVQIANSAARHIFDIAVFLHNQGFRDVRMVVGSDRVKEFEMLLNKYNGQEARHGFYNFDNIQIISAGERDPDADDVSGMSASKMRAMVVDNDLEGFKSGVPSTGKRYAEKMFADIQKGMGIQPPVVGEEVEIEERVMDRSERRKKALVMKRNARKIAVAKKRNAKRKASNDKLEKRAEKQAVNKLRSKFAGEKGANYQTLSVADKMAVDKKIEKKRAIVPKLAKRLMPQVKKAEAERLKSLRSKQNEEVNIQEDSGSMKHHLGIGASGKHMMKHAVKHVDQDNDGDVDALDFAKYVPDEVTGTEKKDQTKKYFSKFSKELQHTKKGDAFESVEEEVTQKQINDLEKFADRLLQKFDIDVEFTRHFADRMNDKRNNPEIKIAELQKFFKKIAKEKGTNIKKHGDAEAVLKDMQTDLNLPVVINYKNGEFEVVNKTIMRKKNFKTTSPEIQYEETMMQSIKKMLALTVQKKQYDKVAKYVLQQYKKDKTKGLEWHAQKAIDIAGLKMDARALAQVVRMAEELIKEDNEQ